MSFAVKKISIFFLLILQKSDAQCLSKQACKQKGFPFQMLCPDENDFVQEMIILCYNLEWRLDLTRELLVYADHHPEDLVRNQTLQDFDTYAQTFRRLCHTVIDHIGK